MNTISVIVSVPDQARYVAYPDPSQNRLQRLFIIIKVSSGGEKACLQKVIRDTEFFGKIYKIMNKIIVRMSGKTQPIM